MWLPIYLVILIVFGIFPENVLLVKDEKTLKRENELKALLNLSIDPCHDFFEFACGNYKTQYPMPNFTQKYDVLDRITENNYEILDTVLRENVDQLLEKELTSAEDKAKVFYSQCNNVDQINAETFHPLLMFLYDNLGGFPALEPWDERGLDWLDMVIVVQKVLHKNPLFEESILLKDGESITDETIPQFSPPSSSLDDSEESKHKLRSIIAELRLSQADNIFDEFYKFYDDLKTMQSFSKNSAKTANISEFKTLVPEFDWQKYMQHVYGKNVKDEDFIAVSDVGYFQLLTCLLHRKTYAEILNFIIFNFISDLLYTLDRGFFEIQNQYEVETQTLFSAKERWRLCIDLTVQLMNYPTAALFLKKANINNSRKNIKELERTLKTAITDFLRTSSWPDNDSKDKTLEKINAFQMDLNWEDFLDNTAKMNEEYKALSIHKTSFLETFINANKFRVQQIGKMYYTKSKEYYPNPLASAQIYRDSTLNKISIPPGLLESPLYHKSFTKFLEYGGLGVLLAHEIFHSFDTLGSHYDADGKKVDWWSENNTALFNDRSQCFKNQYNAYEINNVTLVERPEDVEIIADSSAVKFAYMAYDKFLNTTPNLENENIANLNLTSRQLFFVSMAQGLCTTIRPESLNHVIKTNSYAAGSWRVNGIVQNSPDFSHQFNCPSTSQMNPTNKCSLYS